MSIDYKYNESALIAELVEYIDSTYQQHYSLNKFQATEFIIDAGLGEGFCLGNVMKYAQRYGKKEGKNRKDLMKIIHYGLMALYTHDITEAQFKEYEEARARKIEDNDGPTNIV